MRVPLTEYNHRTLSLLAPVILQTKGHPALASDPLMEDTPVNICSQMKCCTYYKTSFANNRSTHAETYSLKYSTLQLKSPLH